MLALVHEIVTMHSPHPRIQPLTLQVIVHKQLFHSTPDKTANHRVMAVEEPVVSTFNSISIQVVVEDLARQRKEVMGREGAVPTIHSKFSQGALTATQV